jgi:C1A family cysteine protease
MTPLKIKRFGWRPDLPDHRDKLMITRVVPLPPEADLVGPLMPPVYDQGDAGSCTANEAAGAVDYERALQGKPFMTPSRLFIYYNERVLENSVSSDSGATIRDSMKAVAGLGVCAESEWPYDLSKLLDKPNPQCYTDALLNQALSYERVRQVEYDLKYCISILKRPVAFGFSVYESFMSDAVAKTGIVPMPGPNEAIEGGHAVLAVGYKDSLVKCRNSWGTGWGLAGYFWMPKDYLLNRSLASDFWKIMKME